MDDREKTKEQLLHELTALRQRVALSAVDGIVTIDQEGKIIEFNPAAEKLLGYPRSAAVGQLMADLIIPPSLRERPHRGLTHYLATGAGSVLGKRVEMLALRRDGTEFPIEISIARVGAEEPALFTGFLYDITERKRAEQAEREYIKRLRGMYEIAQAILLARSPEEIAKNTLHHLRQLVPCNLAGVALLDFTARETMVLAVDSDGKTRRLQSGGRQPLEMYDGLNVLRQDRVYMVEDVFTCSLPLSVLQRRLAQGVRAYLRVPLTAEGTLLGSLTLRWNSPRAFTPEQVAIAREVASQLAVALQQARLHVAAQRRLQELTAIAQVSDNLRQLHPPDILTSQLLGILEQLLGYDYGAILLLDDATGQLMPFAFNAQKQGKTLGEADQASVLSRQPGLGVEITGWVAHTGKSVCVGDIRQDPRYDAMHDNMRSALCVPLRLGDRVIGVINVESTRPDAYTEADQRVLETVAGQVAIALRNAQLFEQLRSTNARLQSLSHQLVETREAERHAVARELHDDIGQALTAVHINLQTLKNMPAAAWASRLEDSIGILDDTLCRVRNLALSLRPALLDELGLVPALRWYVDQQAQRAKFTVRFVAGSLPRRLPHNIEIACFRIVQEALTNVMRHAQARQVHIALHQRAAALHLVIRDDGNGFDVDAAQQHAAHGRSMGLLNMRERALLAGGQFAITSAPRRGTKIRVQFPV